MIRNQPLDTTPRANLAETAVHITHMSTTTTTTPMSNVAALATAIVTPTAKLSTAAHNYLNAQLTVGRKFESLIDQIKADQTEHGYDQDQCRLIIQTAFKASYVKLGTADKLEPAALTAYVEAGMKRSGTDISKCLRLAFPKSDAAAIELAKGEEAGLGINARLDLAKGNTTFENIMQERANKAAGAKPETARPPGSTPATPTANKPQPPTPMTPAQSKLTPKEQFVTQVIGMAKFGESLGLTLEECSQLAEEWFAEEAARREEAAESAPAAK